MNQFNLFPDPESLNLILKRFTDKANLSEVNYYDFCRQVDLFDVRTFINRNFTITIGSLRNQQSTCRLFQKLHRKRK